MGYHIPWSFPGLLLRDSVASHRTVGPNDAADRLGRRIMSESKGMTSAAPLRILVVDDNKDAADSLSMLLRIWGFEARPIYDGADAIPAAYVYQPDCIVTDIGMPGMNGYQLAEKVRQEESFKGITLIAISAYADAGRVKAAGFDHLLLKPADPDAVQAIVGRLRGMEKRLDQVRKISEQQGQLIKDATAVMKEVKEDVKEIKQELREVKEDVKEIKQELREVKEEKREK